MVTENAFNDDPQGLANYGYTAFQHWKHDQILYKVDHKITWRDVGESFYRASRFLVEGIVAGKIRDEIEGPAAIFLFRHYLELALKCIILAGRRLIREDQNERNRQVKEVTRTHELLKLWELAIRDSKPKMKLGDWENYDTPFVEECLAEFDQVDKKGFAFRYSGAGGEFYEFNYEVLLKEMEHVYQVLEGIETYLMETYHQNNEYDDYLDWRVGEDLL